MTASQQSEPDTGTGYGLRAWTHNARLTEVGRGTSMGELMRRYWQPVGLSSYATDLPRQVRALGEDLILFRDGKGRAGLVHPRCAHRGTSLFYGRIEEEGIRCCYHGWLFDREGHCLEQPGEPGGGATRHKVRQPWYPVQERYGLVWAYMGPPAKKPLLPRYDVLEELDPGERLFADDNNIGAGHAETVVPFNWLQHFENIHDPAHFYWLHYLHSGPQFGARFGEIDLEAIRRNLPEMVAGVKYSVSDRGVTARREAALPDGRRLRSVIETVLPALRVVPNPFGKAGRVDQIGFMLPVDDTGFRIFTVLRAADRQYFADAEQRYAARASWSTEQSQRFPNDFEAQGSQGPITLHSAEHLARSDVGIIMLRRLFDAQIREIEAGRDPLGVRFEPGREYVRLEAGSFIGDHAEAAE